MDNPQSYSGNLTPRTMYSYDNHTNLPWNMVEYNTPVLHNDYKQIMRERLYASQKKGVKVNDFYVTKRGFYMDYELKVAKGVPSSVVHGKQQPWDDTKIVIEGDQLKEVRSSKKYTYLEKMQRYQQMHPVPGITTYKLQKGIDEIHQLLQKNKGKKINYGQKRYFHQNSSFLSDKVPGAGNYNPHDSIQKLHKTRGDWKMWITKHSKWQKTMTNRQAKVPAPATYTPLSQQFKSFASTQKLDQKAKQIKNGFGSDARFPYVRPNKKVIQQLRPSPNAYQTKIDWKGKSVSPKKKQWIKMIWKGSPPKVYK